MSKFCKETVFEGYYTAHYHEGSWLDEKPEYNRKSVSGDSFRRLFKEYLKAYLSSLHEKHPFVGLDEILPEQVYRKLLKNPNKKFRFKFLA